MSSTKLAPPPPQFLVVTTKAVVPGLIQPISAKVCRNVRAVEDYIKAATDHGCEAKIFGWDIARQISRPLAAHEEDLFYGDRAERSREKS